MPVSGLDSQTARAYSAVLSQDEDGSQEGSEEESYEEDDAGDEDEDEEPAHAAKSQMVPQQVCI